MSIKKIILGACLCSFSMVAVAQTPASTDKKMETTASTKGEMKAGAKQTGAGVKRTTRAAAHKTKRAAKAVGNGAKNTTSDVKKEVKK